MILVIDRAIPFTRQVPIYILSVFFGHRQAKHSEMRSPLRPRSALRPISAISTLVPLVALTIEYIWTASIGLSHSRQTKEPSRSTAPIAMISSHERRERTHVPCPTALSLRIAVGRSLTCSHALRCNDTTRRRGNGGSMRPDWAVES